MIEGQIAQNIAELGFPIAMCLWFMFRTEKVIKNNTDALAEVKTVITKCHEVTQKCH